MTGETRSGVQWLDDAPDSWKVVPAKALFRERKERSNSDDVHLTPSQKYGVLPQDEYMAITGNRVVLNLVGGDNMRHVEPGDFISHLRSFQGGLERATTPGKVSAAYTVLSPRGSHVGNFYRWLFKSSAYIQALGATTDQLRDGQSIRFGEFSLVPLPAPPLEEQRAIVDFLDRETAQIDEFVAENERFIELLTERRAAVIAHAVTKGLDPNAPMRDSGVEWLGEIPADWTVAPVVSFARVLTSNVDKKMHDGEAPIRLCNYTDVYYSDRISDSSDFMEATASRDQIARLSVRAGDVPFTKDSETADDIGIPSYVPHDMPGVVYGYHLGIYRPLDGRRSRLLRYQLESDYVKAVFESRTPGVTRVGLSQNTIRYLRVPTPSVEEAAAIADYLDERTERIDEAISTAREGIALAKERRSALISAAVSGKINVMEDAA